MTTTLTTVNALHPEHDDVESSTPKRKRKWYEKHPRRLRNYIILFSIFAIYVTVCVCFYTYYENWDASVSLSFVIETMTTVGFGYHAPSDDNSRIFTVFVMIFGIFVIFGGLSTAFAHRMSHFKTKRSLTLGENDVANAFKDIQKRLGLNIFAIVASLFVASGILIGLEDWSFAKALYFAVQTATTVGYGDIPVNQGYSHNFIMLYTFFSTILMAFAISNLRSLHGERKQLKKALEFAEKQQTLDKLKLLDTGKGVPRDTYILAVLEQLGVINHDIDIKPWIEKFAEYDVNNTGVIHRDEMETLAADQATVGITQAERIRNVDESPAALLPETIRSTFHDVMAMSPLTSPAGSFSTSYIGSMLGGRNTSSSARNSFQQQQQQQQPVVVMMSTSPHTVAGSLGSELTTESRGEEHL